MNTTPKIVEFLDHHVAGLALDLLGGAQQASDITDAPKTSSREFEALRNTVIGALTDRITLVTSDSTLETLRRMLVRTDQENYEGLAPESAVESINVLRAISVGSGGHVDMDEVRQNLNEAKVLTDKNRNKDGKHDLEDAFVVATVLGALGANGSAVLTTNDGGLDHCSSELESRGILVVSLARRTQIRHAVGA